MHKFLDSRIIPDTRVPTDLVSEPERTLNIYRRLGSLLEPSLFSNLNQSLQLRHHILAFRRLLGTLCHDRRRRFQSKNSVCPNLRNPNNIVNVEAGGRPYLRSPSLAANELHRRMQDWQ
jgi:hypothetical protein